MRFIAKRLNRAPRDRATDDLTALWEITLKYSSLRLQRKDEVTKKAVYQYKKQQKYIIFI